VPEAFAFNCIGGSEEAFSSRVADRFCACFAALAVSSQDCDRRSGAGQTLREFTAQNTRSTDYDGYFTFQIEQLHGTNGLSTPDRRKAENLKEINPAAVI
jgi:hypothetical protein